jgi:hypothetical protein
MKYCLTYEWLQEKFPGRVITHHFEKRFNGLSLPANFVYDGSGFAMSLISTGEEIAELLFSKSDYESYLKEFIEWTTLAGCVELFMKYYRGKVSLVDRIIEQASK